MTRIPKKTKPAEPEQWFLQPEECTPVDDPVRVEPDMSAVNRPLVVIGAVLIGLGVVVVVKTWQPEQMATLVGGGGAGLAFVLLGLLLWTRLARFVVRDEWITVFDCDGVVQTRPWWFRWRRLEWERQRGLAVEHTANDVTIRAYPRDPHDLRPDELRFGYRELVFAEKVDEVLDALRGKVLPDRLIEHTGHEMAVAANSAATIGGKPAWPPRTCAVVATVVLLGLTVGLVLLELAGWVGNGLSLLVVPLVACALAARVLARSWYVALAMAAVCLVYWLVACFFSANLISDFVLEARGETVSATAVGTIYDATFVEVRAAGFQSCGGRVRHCAQGFTGVALVDDRGHPLPGGALVPLRESEVRLGEKFDVVRDPRGWVPVREVGDVHPILDSALTLGALAPFYFMTTYTLRRRIRNQATAEL